MKYIKTFKELSKKDAPLAGGKGASLGELIRAGISVPHGFVVTAHSFEFFLKENDLTQEIESILKKVKHKEMESIERASEQIRELILNAEIPEVLLKEIKISFSELKSRFVAVRSSATLEDGKDHAWAGQLDSFLNTTAKNLEENIKKCFASLFTPRAIFYRFEKGLAKSHVSVAIVIQKMIQSEKSGVAFSVHPVTEDYNQMIIEGSWGLGEAIVSGEVTPDSFVIDKSSGAIVDANINSKDKGLYRSSKGSNIWKKIAPRKAKSACLSKVELTKLGLLVKKIEKHYNFPCDIEWGIERGKVYILQSRPITTLK